LKKLYSCFYPIFSLWNVLEGNRVNTVFEEESDRIMNVISLDKTERGGAMPEHLNSLGAVQGLGRPVTRKEGSERELSLPKLGKEL
jgi:hypothetical protein